MIDTVLSNWITWRVKIIDSCQMFYSYLILTTSINTKPSFLCPFTLEELCVYEFSREEFFEIGNGVWATLSLNHMISCLNLGLLWFYSAHDANVLLFNQTIFLLVGLVISFLFFTVWFHCWKYLTFDHHRGCLPIFLFEHVMQILKRSCLDTPLSFSFYFSFSSLWAYIYEHDLSWKSKSHYGYGWLFC